MKEDTNLPVEREEYPRQGTEAPAHLSFRRLAVHEFSTESESEPVRFYYRGHSKHFRAGSSA